nr:immunoglobulin light chain junction region [Macaca mulatta]
CQQGYNLPFTF